MSHPAHIASEYAIRLATHLPKQFSQPARLRQASLERAREQALTLVALQPPVPARKLAAWRPRQFKRNLQLLSILKTNMEAGL